MYVEIRCTDGSTQYVDELSVAAFGVDASGQRGTVDLVSGRRFDVPPDSVKHLLAVLKRCGERVL